MTPLPANPNRRKPHSNRFKRLRERAKALAGVGLPGANIPPDGHYALQRKGTDADGHVVTFIQAVNHPKSIRGIYRRLKKEKKE